MKKLILLTFLLMKSSFAYLVTEEAFKKYQKNTVYVETKVYKNRNELEREMAMEILKSSPYYTVDQAANITTCFINMLADAKKPFQTQDEAIDYSLPCFKKYAFER